MTNMSIQDAQELVLLRITEDKISWVRGVQEFCDLTGWSKVNTLRSNIASKFKLADVNYGKFM